MEVMAGLKNQSLEIVSQIKSFLEEFNTLPVDHTVADIAISVRQKYSVKLPDAIIFATMQHANALLIARNTKNFPVSNPSVRIPYYL